MRDHIECDLTLVAVTQDWPHPCTALCTIELSCCTIDLSWVKPILIVLGAVFSRPRGVSVPGKRAPETRN